MKNRMYDELALERSINAHFGVDVDILQLIVSRAPVSYTSEATLFLTSKKKMYLYVTGQSKLLLSDVKKVISHMGLKADVFIPPKGQPQYFDEMGRKKFREVFPSRGYISDDDIVFYKTLVPYSPALILISEVKNGEIYQFDADAIGSWRITARFVYRRIRMS